MESTQRPTVGMDVIDNSDRLVGTVESVEHDHFVVQKGFFSPQDHKIPMSAIASITDNEVILHTSRHEALNSNPDVEFADLPQHGKHVPDSSESRGDAVRGGLGGIDITKSV